MICIEVHSNGVNGNLHPNSSGSGPVRFNQHTLDAENIINNDTLGEIDNGTQSKFLVGQNVSPKVVGELKYDNDTSRKLLTNAKKIIDISIVDENRKENT